MKICFISEAKTIHAQRWLSGIAASGHEVHLISSSFARIDGIQLHRIELYHANPLRSMYNCLKVRKIVKKIKPDINHLFGLYSVNSLALLPCMYAVSNLVVTPWGTDIVYDFPEKEPYKSKFIKTFLLKQADCITSLSHCMTKHIHKYLLNGRGVEYVPWGADMKVFHPRYRRNYSKEFTIGITKAFTTKYGHEYLLKAIAALVHQSRAPNIKLIIIGKGELESRLKRRVKELEISDYVDFKGYTSDKERLSKSLSHFDVYVMPSVYESETLGVAAIEASAMGIPVIASNIGGIPEVVKHNVTGILTEPGNSGAIADALMLLMRNEELRSAMGRAARKRAEKLFSFSSCVADMNNCYSKLLEIDRAG